MPTLQVDMIPVGLSVQSLDDIVPELHDRYELEVTIIAQVSGLKVVVVVGPEDVQSAGCCRWIVQLLYAPPPPLPCPLPLHGHAASCCACSGEGSVTEVFQPCLSTTAVTLQHRQVI